AITSGVRNMQSVMNLVWDKLLPAMKPRLLPENRAAQRSLQEKLTNLMIRMPTGRPTAPAATLVSGKWYEFPPYEVPPPSGIQAVQLHMNSESPALVVRRGGGEKRTPIGLGAWAKSKGGFSNGIDQFLSVPTPPLLAASGAWT